ncbi:hypothetical protein GCM10008090_16940 [Arenicella chitinivorans]|uniref:Amidohydrolase 3 domain-containing protein n=2 Tax=Arenicella chitinivorans TaxID=1329800 RepID=A0A918RQW9_9GAMM|nr:hypothetical protein GCM10008090_16940 [Arenicella chitinivorans]
MDASRSEATAVLVEDGLITGVGSVADLRAVKPQAQLDDSFAQHIIYPGFIDPHVHMLLGALIYSRPFTPPWDMQTPQGIVKGLADKSALLARLKELDAQLSNKNTPLITYGYHNLIHGEITRHDLDTVSSQRPILLWHYSAHDFYLNSAALEWAKVDANLSARYVGVELDSNGELTGRLYEDAPKYLFEKLAFQLLTPGNVRRGFNGFERLLADGGVTTVAELGYGLFGRRLEDLYYLLEYTDDDPYRLYLVPEFRAFQQVYGDDTVTAVAALAEEEPDRGKPQVLRQIKFFTDGAFYSQTMRLDPPGYLAANTEHQLGLWVTPEPMLAEEIQPFWDAGFGIRIHSNGDAAQTATLNAMTSVRANNPSVSNRFVIEHAGLVLPTQIERLQTLDGGVSAASHYVYYMGDSYQTALGERTTHITPLASLKRSGIPTTLHSDAPLAPPSPLRAAAVHTTRETRAGHISNASEALTPYAALQAITIDAAWALGKEAEIGSIEIGKRADFTILGEDPLQRNAKEWSEIEVWGVVIDGIKYPRATNLSTE